MTEKERNLLFENNQGLVYLVAKKYGYNADIIQEGLIALWRVSKKFDETRGVKFSSYAVKAIHNRIVQYVIHERKFEVINIETVQLSRDDTDMKQIEVDMLIDQILDKKDGEIFKEVLAGGSLSEIAKKMGVSNTAIWKRTENAKKRIRKEMTKDA